MRVKGTGRERRPPNPVLTRLGAFTWVALRVLSQRWPCPQCRPNLTQWTEGLHDAVSSRLGRPPFRAVSFGRFTRGELEGRYHRACLGCRTLRLSLRLVARVPRGQTGAPRLRTRAEAAAVGIGNGFGEEERP